MMQSTGSTTLTNEPGDYFAGASPIRFIAPWNQQTSFREVLPEFIETPIQIETDTALDLDQLPLELKCILLLWSVDLPKSDLHIIYETIENVVKYHLEPKVLQAASQKGSDMVGAKDVAKYFISLVSNDEGDLISNLKLQKLLYYAQGFSLALLDKPLFPEPLEAWIHGPVVPEVYHEYKRYGRGAISPEIIDFSQLDEEIQELLNEVYLVYGQYSASTLRNLTHEEPPWKETPSGEEISLEVLKSYFLTQVVDGEEE